jgi:hypothetical protein
MSNPDEGPSRAPSLFDGIPDAHHEGDHDQASAADAWPHHERFPLNEESRYVEEAISASYKASQTFTIVTGFTSLEYLLSFFSRHEVGDRTVDIVLGNEPTPRDNPFSSAQPIEGQARAYWLQRGVSILTGGGVVRLIDAIESGQVRFFASDNLHAKIYAGDEAAVLGSSNFSRQGLRAQREANARFERGSRRYRELYRIADRFKSEATPCSTAIRTLLEDLLQPVRWEEALARAAAEILEGDWVSRYPSAFRLLQKQSLWPHQEQAIAQGLWILDTRGSVLLADATGSGKTRVGTHLLYGLLNRLWSAGQGHRTKSTVICPPSVTDNWSMEIQESPASSVQAISHGKLSQGNDLDRVHRRVRKSNVLFLDEAHNYLARNSERSRAVEASAPDYAALLTATPINRGSGDLLRMIELLGLDNLSDREFTIYTELRRKNSLTADDEHKLRDIVRQRTIRRTKQDLNRQVEREPDGYRTGGDGAVHRYPEHLCKTYATGETEDDQRLARDINALAEQLRGLLWLRSFKAPYWILEDPEQQRRFIESNVRAASGLVAHMVRSALQSSRAALLEVIYGTAEAACRVDLDQQLKEASGNFLERVGELLDAPPATRSNLKIDLPGWLDEGLAESVQREQELLRQIGAKASQLSDARMEARADKIVEIAAAEPVLLAFGARPLTLYHLRKTLRSRSLHHDVVVADGGLSSSERRAITRRLGLDGDRQLSLDQHKDVSESGPRAARSPGCIALCSDAMSEGLNLQRAASVVLLDTPSVIRIAEQRVGRIDRMNSPHEAITVWWPDDSLAFQSQRRDLLLERFNVNGRLLGNNIKIPASIEEKASDLFSNGGETRVSATALIEVYKAHQTKGPEERLEDAFQPVRQLVGLEDGKEGPAPLILRTLYEEVAGMKASVWSRITIRSSTKRWGFFCLRGQEGRAPRWLLLRRGYRAQDVEAQGHRTRNSGSKNAQTNPKGLGFESAEWTVRTRLNTISDELRHLLRVSQSIENQRNPKLWASVESELSDMLTRVRANEWELLSNRARHGLSLLKNLLPRYQGATEPGSERDRVCAFLRKAISKTREPWVDIHDLADRWLGIVQPEYIDQKQAESRGRSDPIRLKDMEGPLAQDPVTTDSLRTLAHSVRRDEPIKRRIVSAIIAVPTGMT